MDEIKAIQIITKWMDFIRLGSLNGRRTMPVSVFELLQGCTLAIDALGKQIPKPCKTVRRKYQEDYYCPVCGKQQKDTYKTRRKGCFCERCGQALTLGE